MEDKSSITALMSAFGRAFHAENEEYPVFRDDLAREWMTAEEYAALQSYVLGGASFFEAETDWNQYERREILRHIVNVHLAPSPLCRAAYAEKILRNELQTGTRQYVILGAGYDTVAFRKKELLSPCKVFEVDHPLTQADKKMRIQRAGWDIPQNLTWVPVDFTKDVLEEKLLACGFDQTVKTLFSWLGVTYYLTVEAIEKMLDGLSGICAEGSAVVLDYPDENFLTATEKRVQNTIQMAMAGGEAMKSSISYAELEKLLDRHGFLIYEHLTPDEIQREIIEAAGAEMKAFEHVNYCLAVRKR